MDLLVCRLASLGGGCLTSLGWGAASLRSSFRSKDFLNAGQCQRELGRRPTRTGDIAATAATWTSCNSLQSKAMVDTAAGGGVSPPLLPAASNDCAPAICVLLAASSLVADGSCRPSQWRSCALAATCQSVSQRSARVPSQRSARAPSRRCRFLHVVVALNRCGSFFRPRWSSTTTPAVPVQRTRQPIVASLIAQEQHYDCARALVERGKVVYCSARMRRRTSTTTTTSWTTRMTSSCARPRHTAKPISCGWCCEPTSM
jgi:hypothetical protein